MCTHTSKRRQKRDCTRPKREGKARRRRRLVVRVSSRSSRSLSHPRFFGLATHERERERGRRRRRFPAFFTSRIVCKSRRPPVRSIERRASSKSSRPTCFFSLERNDKRTTPRAICRRRACFRARADIGRRWSKRLRPASKGILHFRDTGLFKILNRKSVASSLEGAHFSQRPSFLSPRDEKKQVR